MFTKIINAIRDNRCIPQQQQFIITDMGDQEKSEICLQIANKARQKYVKWTIFWWYLIRI